MLDSTYTAYNKSEIEKPFVMLFAAPRRSGKSYLIKKLLIEGKIGKQFDHIIIASPSLEYDDEFEIEEQLGKKVEVHKFTTNLKENIASLIEQQQEANKLHKENPKLYEAIHTLLILDDCIDSKLAQFRSTENVTDMLAERGRHFNMSLIVSCQTLTGHSTSLRRNCEYLFLFSPTNYADTERVLDEYVPQEARKEFRKLTTKVFKQPYAFMMIDNSPKRRMHYKLRFRDGFTRRVFDLKKGELEEPILEKKRKRVTTNEENLENKKPKTEEKDESESE